ARGGKAVGKTSDGQVVFVQGAAPDETVRAEVTATSARFAEAKTVEVLTPGPSRVTPPCPVVDTCGGCPWQHISYDEQVRQKDAILRDTLKRGRAITDEGLEKFSPFIESPEPFRYRARVTLQTRKASRGLEIGFTRRESHDFVPIEDCLIAHKELIPFARSLVSSDKERVKRDRFQVVRDDAGNLSVGGAFTQVNRLQNERLQALVSQHICHHVQNDRRQILHWHLLDLYSGNGNLTFPIVEAVRRARPELVIEATGVEGSKESVADAKRNPRAQQCSFVAEDVEAWLGRQKAGAVSLLSKKGLPLDEIIVLDPPRDGCGKTVMSKIARRKPSLIVYVSCDPATLTRDLVRFNEAVDRQKTKYEILEIGGLDMFPQTDHIEAFVVMRRKVD
ncbi:MAG: TRAM domain-containing protein, partial [Bdellovibrionales bacterium]|nr:TRAM domain-containing protein [Bdellovibrionales bacterium]